MDTYLAIDYGLERTGLAISDPDGRMALPLCVLKLADYGKRSRQLDALAEIARSYKTDAVVIGLPLHEDGSESLMARCARNVGSRIKRRLNQPVFLEPEFLSSFEAEQDLAALKHWRKHLDAQAACRILYSFLAKPEHLRTLL